MLTICERHQVLKIFRIWCIIAQFPVPVDLKSWELKNLSERRRLICAGFGISLALHTLYKACSLAHAYLFVPDVPLYQLVIHAVVVIGCTVGGYWYYVAYIQDPVLFVALFKITLLGNIQGPLGSKNQSQKTWTERLREYSLQDLIAIGMPYMTVLSVVLISAAYVYDPTIRLLLYAALPSGLQTWVTFGLLILEEARVLLVLLAIATPIWQLQVIAFDLMSNKLQLALHKIQKGDLNFMTTYRLLRSLQLYISIFNNMNGYLIFTWKLASISVAVITGYAAVAHFREYPLFGIMYYVILLNSVFNYTVIYEKAFKIPQLFEEVARHALLRICGIRAGRFRRQMRSIPRTGVNVGHFHKMERESTLIYMDFVLQNIVGMLVAYR